MKKLAFTIAEVLITLGIIGIVAEITIPPLVANIQVEIAKAKWKEVFSIVDQATLQIKQDNFGSLMSVFTSDATMASLYTPKVKTTASCSASCLFAGSTSTFNNTITLADGALIAFSGSSSTCAAALGTTLCGQIYIDIDGNSRGQNACGSDIFWVGINPNFNIPAGSQGLTGAVASGTCYATSYSYLFQ